MYNYDFMSLQNALISFSELHASISLTIDGDNIVRSDLPRGLKREGVCCYFKGSPTIKMLKKTPMTEFLVLEMLYSNKLVIVSVIYRSPSQSSQELQNLKCFLVNF